MFLSQGGEMHFYSYVCIGSCLFVNVPHQSVNRILRMASSSSAASLTNSGFKCVS